MEASLIMLANQDGDEVFDVTDKESEYVIAWLRIDGTNIDYPVVQGKNNTWFLNRNYKGEFATAGSLFLDYRNSMDFSDNFSIIYGHRMGNGEMFSDIQKFKDGDFFSSHRNGVLKRRGVSHDLEIVVYAEIDARNWNVYNTGVSRMNDKYGVTEEIFDAAIWRRDDGGNGRFVLLSTCDGQDKDKRDVLLVRLLGDMDG